MVRQAAPSPRTASRTTAPTTSQGVAPPPESSEAGSAVTVGSGEATTEAARWDGRVGVADAVGDGDADAGAAVLVNVTVPDTGWPSVLTTR